jgi:hypothetical protein
MPKPCSPRCPVHVRLPCAYRHSQAHAQNTNPQPPSVQVELKFGQGPKTTVVELIKANDWMLPQLLAVYNILEKNGLVDSAAQGSDAARSNYAVVQRFRERQAHEYPEHGIRDLHLSSPHLLHAGLEALMADAGASGQGWPGLAPTPHVAASNLLLTISKETFKPDFDGEREICKCVLTLLIDQSSGVHGLALNWCVPPPPASPGQSQSRWNSAGAV